jgi:hypothetical protein
VASLSNDSVPALKHAAERLRIPFPLLSDPSSTLIARLGARNAAADDAAFGGTVLVDERGVVRSKFFEENFRERRSAASILFLEGELPPGGTELRTDHFGLRLSSTNPEAFPQQRLTLVLDLQMGEGRHAYAPEARGYRPLQLRLDPHPFVRPHETSFPKSHPYLFKPLNETVPVFEGRFQVTKDVTLAWSEAVHEFIQRNSPPLVRITGALDYQVCDERICYPPASLPVSWTIKLLPFDDGRVPEELRRPRAR